MRKSLFAIASIGFISLFLGASSAQAVIVGVAGRTPAAWLATPGNNDFMEANVGEFAVNLTDTVTLPAGTYKASTFDYVAKQDGNVTPFLAVVTPGFTGNGSPTDQFTYIAVGNTQTVSGGITSDTTFSTAFGGSDTFTLSSTTTIYTGFNSTAQALPVDTTGTGRGFIDLFTISAITPVTPGNTTMFNFFGFNRDYGFDVQITAPEPASLTLLAAGAAACVMRRRRAA